MKTLGIALLFAFSATVHAASHIVYIGDSHSAGQFGTSFDEWLRTLPGTFDFVAAGGASASDFVTGKFVSGCGYVDSSANPVAPVRKCDEHYTTPSLAKILENSSSVKDRLVLIALGTNYSAKAEDRAWQLNYTVKLLKTAAAAGARCIWIGPPNMRESRFSSARLEKHYSIVRDAIAQAAKDTGSSPCTLIDSRPISKYPEPADPKKENPDGIHYDFPASWYRFPEGKAAAAEWAKSAISQIKP